MAIRDDGDVIHGLGFVALYAAYLEEAVDGCVEVLLSIDPEADDRMYRQPTSKKIEYCRRRLAALAPLSDELERLPEALNYVAGLFEHRNEVLHGRIYGQYGRPDQLRSGRRGVPDRDVTSAELYDLANELEGAPALLMHASVFGLPRHIAERKTNHSS